MPRWFPRSDNKPGVNKALLAGFIGALIVAAAYVYDGAARALEYPKYSAQLPRELEIFLLISWVVRPLVALIAAWRFAVGKGLVWGSVVLLLFVLPVLIYFALGMAAPNIGLIVLRIVAGVTLIAGIRGAWAARTIEPDADYAEVFE